jgi:Methyltransferase FkbM domain
MSGIWWAPPLVSIPVTHDGKRGAEEKRRSARVMRWAAATLLGERRATWLAERTVAVRGRPQPTFSAGDAETEIRRFLEGLGSVDRYAVDIGASDGWTSSNTYFMFRRGWKGLALECDDGRFEQLRSLHARFKTEVVHAKVTPLNVVELLRSHDVRPDFTFLSIDIDGYDYFVLEALLTQFRPKLICAEINEAIPPPLRFSVKWDPDHSWSGDHFFGQSISQLAALGRENNYALVGLHYNNAFLAPSELDVAPSLTAEEAFQRGYAAREHFPWNEDVEPALAMDAAEAEAFFRELFAAYEGRYELVR